MNPTSPEAEDSASMYMTIEQLALRSGVSTRNIRAYQTKGLLPPPVVLPGGRTGYYSGSHVARLRLIGRLQAAGHSLAGAASLLSAWESGHTLDQMLGLGEVVETARAVGTQLIPRQKIEEFLPEPIDGPHWLAALISAGALAERDDGYELRHPDVIAFAAESLRSGVPAQVMVDELPHVLQALGAIAERFVNNYREYVVEPFITAGMPIEKLPAMQEQLRNLHDLSQKCLASMVCEAIDREIESLSRRMLAERSVTSNNAKAAGPES